MFQTFQESADPSQGPDRLAALRAEMVAAGLDAFLVPRADAHQGEYVADRDARLAWLTGFTGSAGFAAVLADVAGVFVDGRYRVQVRSQVADVFSPVDWPEVQLQDWLKDMLAAGKLGGGKVGFDPWLHTVDQVAKLRASLGEDAELIGSANLVDRIWQDQPAPPAGAAYPYPDALAGRSSAEKRADCAAALRTAGHDAVVLTLPDSICWLLNIRGADIARIPVVLCFAILHSDGQVDLFVDTAKMADVTLGDDVRLHGPEGFASALAAVTGRVRIDAASAPYAVEQALKQAEVCYGDDPCVMPKACKTKAEVDGSREAHLRDGAAMCEFLCWLDQQEIATLTEIDVVTALEGFRRATNALRDISFDTICGSGPNGAIVHYRVTEHSNRKLSVGDVLLVDSGGQYLDGTTDITRTVALGDVGAEPREAFTRVLQGMIAISRLRWPEGMAGRDLDAAARIPLWRAGLDYAHGTGHGVGAYLSVHEGPARLSRVSDVALRAGMILSNEPGFYREGAYGIRIENLIVVAPAPHPDGATIKSLLEFETLTYVPIDRAMIVADMLSADERDWIDSYHAKVAELIAPRLSGAAQSWLANACAPLGS